VVVEGLRLHADAVIVLANAAETIAIADGDEKGIVATEEDPSGKVAACLPGVGNEDLGHLSQLRPVEAAS
jgi:hypothetical protein